MIAIKTVMFFLSLGFSFAFIEDVIDNIILYSKTDATSYWLEHKKGEVRIFSVGLGLTVILFWSGFYLLNIL